MLSISAVMKLEDERAQPRGEDEALMMEAKWEVTAMQPGFDMGLSRVNQSHVDCSSMFGGVERLIRRPYACPDQLSWSHNRARAQEGNALDRHGQYFALFGTSPGGTITPAQHYLSKGHDTIVQS